MRTLVLLTAVCLAAQLAFAQADGEKKITKQDVPKPVLEAFQKAYPKADMKGFATESEKGKLFYEIESVDGKINRDLLYAPDGTVVSIEETVDAANLPEPITTYLKAEFPKAKVTTAEAVREGGKVTYELSLKGKGIRASLVFDGAGKLVSKNVKEVEKKEKGEKKEKKESKEEKEEHEG